MLIKACARCGKLIAYGRPHCPACAEAAEAERAVRTAKRKRMNDRAYNRRRDPKYARFYASAEWRRLSQAKMSDAGYKCEGCGRIAAEVHHIVPVQTPEGWDLRLAWDNLEAVCVKCHNRRHGRWGKSASEPGNGMGS